MTASRRASWSILAFFVAIGPVRAQFVDVAGPSGFFGGQPTWGAQIVDVEGDGDLDVFNAHHFYSGFLFVNDGTGHLSVWSLPQLLTGTADRHGYLWADFDGDTIVDVVCSHGSDGGCAGCSDDGHELWRGDGGGTFTPVPDAGGMYDQLGRGRAFSAADVDGDGDLDLYHAKAPQALSPNSLYRNDGAMTFVDVAPAWGVDEVLGTVAGLFADVDDDGDPDLFVAGDEFQRPTTLFRNEGSSFTDITAVAFAGAPPVFAGADFGDMDGDGDLDLVAVEGQEAVYDMWKVEGNVFTFFSHFRFNDDGVDVFELDTPGSDPVAGFRYRGSLWNDYIFLGPSGVHPTSTSVTLTDAYVGAPSFTPGVDTGLYCWRESPGGRWLIHVSAPPGDFGSFNGTVTASAGIADPSASNLEPLVVAPSMVHLYRNDGGTFVDVTAEQGMPEMLNPRHVTWVDFDLDGDLDVHVVVRGTVDTGNLPDALLRNDGGTFTVLQGTGWAPGLASNMADGAVWGDLDRDGDPDVVVQEGSGPLAFTIGTPALLYRNDAAAGSWLSVTLAPPPAGATAIGARVDAWANGNRVHRRLHANSWRGFQPPAELSLGLGAVSLVDSLVVTWPGGSLEKFGPFAVNQRVVIVPGTSPSAAGESGAATRSFAGLLAPQPARGIQRMALTARAGGLVEVTVYDLAGRLVRSLGRVRTAGPLPVEVTWDGRDGRGRRVPAGVYFLRGTGALEFHRKSVRLP